MQTGYLRLQVNDSYMPTYLATPDGPGPFPGVVVAMHIFGLDRFVRGKCEELAEAGFVAVAPYLFHRTWVILSTQTRLGGSVCLRLRQHSSITR
jgi:dienelactone hydrolase